MKREKWIVKNISANSLSVGILNMPALRSQNHFDLLMYASKEQIGQNSTIRDRLLDASVEIYKYKDGLLVTTINASNALTALTSAEEDQI
jgi:hypothetical protein